MNGWMDGWMGRQINYYKSNVVCQGNKSNTFAFAFAFASPEPEQINLNAQKRITSRTFYGPKIFKTILIYFLFSLETSF